MLSSCVARVYVPGVLEVIMKRNTSCTPCWLLDLDQIGIMRLKQQLDIDDFYADDGLSVEALLNKQLEAKINKAIMDEDISS